MTKLTISSNLTKLAAFIKDAALSQFILVPRQGKGIELHRFFNRLVEAQLKAYEARSKEEAEKGTPSMKEAPILPYQNIPNFNRPYIGYASVTERTTSNQVGVFDLKVDELKSTTKETGPRLAGFIYSPEHNNEQFTFDLPLRLLNAYALFLKPLKHLEEKTITLAELTKIYQNKDVTDIFDKKIADNLLPWAEKKVFLDNLEQKSSIEIIEEIDQEIKKNKELGISEIEKTLKEVEHDLKEIEEQKKKGEVEDGLKKIKAEVLKEITEKIEVLKKERKEIPFKVRNFIKFLSKDIVPKLPPVKKTEKVSPDAETEKLVSPDAETEKLIEEAKTEKIPVEPKTEKIPVETETEKLIPETESVASEVKTETTKLEIPNIFKEQQAIKTEKITQKPIKEKEKSLSDSPITEKEKVEAITQNLLQLSPELTVDENEQDPIPHGIPITEETQDLPSFDIPQLEQSQRLNLKLTEDFKKELEQFSSEKEKATFIDSVEKLIKDLKEKTEVKKYEFDALPKSREEARRRNEIINSQKEKAQKRILMRSLVVFFDSLQKFNLKDSTPIIKKVGEVIGHPQDIQEIYDKYYKIKDLKTDELQTKIHEPVKEETLFLDQISEELPQEKLPSKNLLTNQKNVLLVAKKLTIIINNLPEKIKRKFEAPYLSKENLPKLEASLNQLEKRKQDITPENYQKLYAFFSLFINTIKKLEEGKEDSNIFTLPKERYTVKILDDELKGTIPNFENEKLKGLSVSPLARLPLKPIIEAFHSTPTKKLTALPSILDLKKTLEQEITTFDVKLNFAILKENSNKIEELKKAINTFTKESEEQIKTLDQPKAVQEILETQLYQLVEKSLQKVKFFESYQNLQNKLTEKDLANELKQFNEKLNLFPEQGFKREFQERIANLKLLNQRFFGYRTPELNQNPNKIIGLLNYIQKTELNKEKLSKVTSELRNLLYSTDLKQISTERLLQLYPLNNLIQELPEKLRETKINDSYYKPYLTSQKKGEELEQSLEKDIKQTQIGKFEELVLKAQLATDNAKYAQAVQNYEALTKELKKILPQSYYSPGDATEDISFIEKFLDNKRTLELIIALEEKGEETFRKILKISSQEKSAFEELFKNKLHKKIELKAEDPLLISWLQEQPTKMSTKMIKILDKMAGGQPKSISAVLAEAAKKLIARETPSDVNIAKDINKTVKVPLPLFPSMTAHPMHSDAEKMIDKETLLQNLKQRNLVHAFIQALEYNHQDEIISIIGDLRKEFGTNYEEKLKTLFEKISQTYPKYKTKLTKLIDILSFNVEDIPIPDETTIANSKIAKLLQKINYTN